MSEHLETLFARFKGQNTLFVRQGGNWGDHLIYWGADSLAERLGLKYSTQVKDEFLTSQSSAPKVIYIHGGGGLNQWCSDSVFACIKHSLKLNPNELIVGPCSSSSNKDFLEKALGDALNDLDKTKVTIFAREKQTFSVFNQLKCLKGRVQIGYDKDTAFHLSKDIIEKRIGKVKENYRLYAFREDNEAPSQSHSNVNFNQVVLDPAYYAKSFDHWLRLHAHANEIVTNRTHSSVVGALLGKPTSVFSSSYHKNRMIWEECLSKLNVKWLETEEAFNKLETGFSDKMLPGFIRKSWRVRELYFRLRSVPLK